MIWSVFGRAMVDLLASEDNFHCPNYFLKQQDALANNWTSFHLYAFPLISLLFQVVIRRVREARCSAGGPILDESDVVS